MALHILSRSFLNLERLARFPDGRRARGALLVLGCALIPAWQATFWAARDRLSDRYRLQASTGLLAQDKFVYFLYYLGLFPVATEREDLVYSRDAARELLARHGETLLMEWKNSYRSGSLGTTLLYLPDALLKGAPRDPSVRPCNAMALTAGLVALFVSFWYARQAILGLLLVVLLGSNPFQLHEVYARENTFGWPITTAVWLLALHAPLLGERKAARGFLWAVPVAAGLLLASVKQVRPEPLVLILSPLGCYLLLAQARWLVRVGLALVLVAAYGAGTWAWASFFDAKFAQARRVVEQAGGHPYVGPRSRSHLFWHPIWCGLGDFDTTHGYKWDDQAAADYALPVLERDYGVKVPAARRTRVLFENTYWDKAGRYYVMPYELPHYEDVIRDKVLGDIARDPLWYFGILAQRAWRIARQTTSPRLAFGVFSLEIPMHGLIAVPVLALLAARRCWMMLKLVGFVLPLSLPALLIFSGLGLCHYSCYPLVVTALIAAWLAEAALHRLAHAPAPAREGAAK